MVAPSVGDGLGLARAVAEHACEIADFGNPAAIVLSSELDLERHKGTLALGWLPNERPHLTPAAVVSSGLETSPRGRRK